MNKELREKKYNALRALDGFQERVSKLEQNVEAALGAQSYEDKFISIGFLIGTIEKLIDEIK